MAQETAKAQPQSYPSSGWRKFWADYSESPLAVVALLLQVLKDSWVRGPGQTLPLSSGK